MTIARDFFGNIITDPATLYIDGAELTIPATGWDAEVFCRIYQYEDDLSVADAEYKLDNRFSPVYGEQFINSTTIVVDCSAVTRDGRLYGYDVTLHTDWYTIPRED